MLSQDEVLRFHRDGYVAARGVIDSTTLQKLRGTADELLEESRSVAESNGRFDLETGHTAANPRLARISHPVVERSLFWEVATSPAVLDCVAALMGENLKFHHSKLNWKTSGGGAEIGWHQDFAFFPHTNMDLVACGIALDDATRQNGCLLVVPGTHTYATLDHWTPEGEFVGQLSGELPFDPAAAAAVELQAGDMSIHHVNVVHGSLRNDSPNSRRLLIYQFGACDAVQLDRRPLANEFTERVVRGVPATHARLLGAAHLKLRGELGAARSIFERQRAASARTG